MEGPIATTFDHLQLINDLALLKNKIKANKSLTWSNNLGKV